MIKLSIVIPNFNSGNLLEESLNSIFKVPVSFSFEVLIMDNCSSDYPERIVEKYQFDNLYFFSEPDSGIYDAMNKGIKKAKGEWLYFLGSGDKLKISKLNNGYLDLSFDLIYFKVFLKSKNVIEGYKVNLFDILRCNLCQQAIFYHASVFEALGEYSLDYKILSDYEFNMRVFFSEFITKKFIDEVVSEYKGGGVSAQIKDDLFNLHKNRIIIKLLLFNFSINNMFFVVKYYKRYVKNKLRIEIKKINKSLSDL